MVSVLTQSVEVLPSGPLRTRAMSSLAMELTYEWRSSEAEAIGERAVQSARVLPDDALFADVVALQTLALWGKPGAADLRLDLAEEALARDLSQEGELYLRFGAAAAHLQAGRAAEAEAQMTRCVELTRRLRHSGADIPVAWWRFYRAIDRGDDPAARMLLAEAMERHRLSSVVGFSVMEPMAMLRLGELGSEVPDSFVEQGRSHANPAHRAMVGHALAEAGRPMEGVAVLGAPVPDGAWDYASMYGDCLRVDVLSAAGRTEPLRDALARIQPWGRELAIFGSTDCIGSIDYFIGRGLEGLRDIDGARAAYARAAEANRVNDVVPWQRRAELRLGRLADRPDHV